MYWPSPLQNVYDIRLVSLSSKGQ